MELAGIPEKLIDWAATRNKATMQRLAELADQYQERTRQPLTTKIRQRLMERASQETRPAKKKTSQPLPALRARWRDGAVALVGEEVVDSLLRLARLAAAAIRTTVRTAVDVAAAALEITAIVSVHHGGRFRHRHLLAEARRYLTHTLHGHPAPPHTDTTITAAAIRDHCIPGDPPNPNRPMPLANRTFTPAWAPKSPRSSTTPAAHRIHHRARAEAARRAVLARAEAQQRSPVRQQEHTPQMAPQQPPLPAPAVGRWLAAKSFPDIAAVTGWLHLIAALVVAGVGVSMLLRHLRRREHHHRGQGHDHVLGGGHGLGGGGRGDGGPGAGRGTARGAVTPIRERQRTRRRSHPCHCRRRRRLVQRWSPQGQMIRLI
jgi:hypothetical protein